MKENTSKRTKKLAIVVCCLALLCGGIIWLTNRPETLESVNISNRDTLRRMDLGEVRTQIISYQADNRGNVPESWSAFAKDYLGNNFSDPSGNNYVIVGCSYDTDRCRDISFLRWSTDGHYIYATTGASCVSDYEIAQADSARSVAIYMALEGGGSICQNNY